MVEDFVVAWLSVKALNIASADSNEMPFPSNVDIPLVRLRALQEASPRFCGSVILSRRYLVILWTLENSKHKADCVLGV